MLLLGSLLPGAEPRAVNAQGSMVMGKVSLSFTICEQGAALSVLRMGSVPSIAASTVHGKALAE